jgi:hypothetical protein
MAQSRREVLRLLPAIPIVASTALAQRIFGVNTNTPEPERYYILNGWVLTAQDLQVLGLHAA